MSLSQIVTNPNGKIRKQAAIEMGFELLLAERDDLMEYVKALKVLAVYLTGKTNILPEDLSKKYFTKAEKNFSEHIRREMDIDIQD